MAEETTNISGEGTGEVVDASKAPVVTEKVAGEGGVMEGTPENQVDDIADLLDSVDADDEESVIKKFFGKGDEKEEKESSKPEEREMDKKEEDKKEDKKEEKEEKKEDSGIAALLEKIAALESTVANLKDGKKEEKKEATEKKEGEKEEGTRPAILYLQDEAEYDKIFDDKEAFETVLRRVAANAKEETLKTIPNIITNIVATQVPLIVKINEFYKSNSDLRGNEKFVGDVANDLMSKNPGWSQDKLFEELSGEVKKRLSKVEDGKKKVARKEGEGPGFAGKGSGARSSTKVDSLTPLQEEIIDLIS
jgi:hypothetical protein